MGRRNLPNCPFLGASLVKFAHRLCATTTKSTNSKLLPGRILWGQTDLVHVGFEGPRVDFMAQIPIYMKFSIAYGKNHNNLGPKGPGSQEALLGPRALKTPGASSLGFQGYPQGARALGNPRAPQGPQGPPYTSNTDLKILN